MPVVTPPVDVVTVPGQLVITEYFGNAATNDPRLSAAHVRWLAAGEEDWQTPEFDEWVLIISGEVRLEHAGGPTLVSSGSGVFLPKGLRVKWVFPGPCEYVPLCLPAFSPDNVHREEPGAEAAPAAAATEGVPAVFSPVDVVKAGDLTITEFFGRVASKDERLSACLAVVSAPCAEAYQAPDFDEYVLVLKGKLQLHQADGVTEVEPGRAVFLKAGERVKWVWPGECTYIPLCLPAFSPDNCHREQEEGAAKDEACMARLHELHGAGAAETLQAA
jgi:uncharacterized cupin superfamily protein